MTKATTPGHVLLRWQFAHPQPKPIQNKRKFTQKADHSELENTKDLTKKINPK